MQKKNIVIALVVLICIAVLSSCAARKNEGNESDTTSNPYTAFNDWSNELEQEIKRAYWLKGHANFDGFDISEVPMYYFGTYSGYAAVRFLGFGDAVVLFQYAGGHEFFFSNSNGILMYKDGVFADLADVFNDGKISQEDVDRLYEKYTYVAEKDYEQ